MKDPWKYKLTNLIEMECKSIMDKAKISKEIKDQMKTTIERILLMIIKILKKLSIKNTKITIMMAFQEIVNNKISKLDLILIIINSSNNILINLFNNNIKIFNSLQIRIFINSYNLFNNKIIFQT